MNKDFMEGLHQLCSNNKFTLQHVETAGCFYCERTFEPSEIKEWVRSRKVGEVINYSDALCPRCGTDSVLPGITDKEILRDMHDYWFRAVGWQDEEITDSSDIGHSRNVK